MNRRAPWALGAATYFIEREPVARPLITAVECRLAGQTERNFALLDTGAHWSLVGGELASRLGESVGTDGPRISVSTRLGTHTGTLERLTVTLLALPGQGVDVDIDATVLLAPSWTGPIVLGTRGLLERVRFELDPDQTGDDCWWSFAAATR